MRFFRIIVLLAIPVALLAAGDEKKTATKPEAVKRLTLPPDAKEFEPYTYRHTDAEGKTWIYRRTPFGLYRLEEKDQEAASSAQSTPDNGLLAFDEGDQVRFERQSPFGEKSWVRKKTELTTEEKKAWDFAVKQKKARKTQE